MFCGSRQLKVDDFASKTSPNSQRYAVHNVRKEAFAEAKAMVLTINMAENRIKLNICGVICTLITEESEEYMLSLGKEAESLISALMRSSGSLSVAAVTAALSYLDELKKSGAQQNFFSVSEEEVDELKKRLRELTAENERLMKENRELSGKNKKQSHGSPVFTNPLRQNEDFDKESMISFYAKED